MIRPSDHNNYLCCLLRRASISLCPTPPVTPICYTPPSMRILCATVLCALLSLPAVLSAEEVRVYPIATNFSGEGKVIELDFPENAGGVPFYTIWQTLTGQGNVPMQARAGRHCYEMRHRVQWEGPIRLVGITVPGVPGRLKNPTLSDEIDMLFQPDMIAPSTVNFLEEHRLLGISQNIVLAILAFLATLGFLILKKTTFAQALVFAFLAAWTVASLQNVYSHITVVSMMETHKSGMFGVQGLAEFADHAAGMIGTETWDDNLDGFLRSNLHYRLAEHQYAFAASRPAAAFRISQKPEGGQVVWQNADYYLVKNTPR
jgi:hypothetical protein